MKYIVYLSFFTWLLLHGQATTYAVIEVDEKASIADSKTGILGINHIGLSVANLDLMLEFYQNATDFELVRREVVTRNTSADALYGRKDVALEIAVLQAPNMMFELIEFRHNKEIKQTPMLPQGPGITHTCFQSPIESSGYDRFVAAGANTISRGNRPIDLGGYGVRYAYAHDPEGNMFEMEELEGEVLARAGYDRAWQELDEDLWMSQVGIATHDIEKLMSYYQKILAIKPYRVTKIKDNPRVDEIANIDNAQIKGGWFKMNTSSKVLEFWEYINPATEPFNGQRSPTSLGYSFSFEVSDIQSEFERLGALGVEFLGVPVSFGGMQQVYAKDIDGNIFSLRQYVDDNSEFSVRTLDKNAIRSTRSTKEN